MGTENGVYVLSLHLLAFRDEGLDGDFVSTDIRPDHAFNVGMVYELLKMGGEAFLAKFAIKSRKFERRLFRDEAQLLGAEWLTIEMDHRGPDHGGFSATEMGDSFFV